MVYCVRYGITGKVAFEVVENVNHYNPPGHLRFILGNDRFYKAPQGFFFGVNYGINKGIYADTQ